MAKKAEKDATHDTLNIRIPKELKHQFKIWCVMNHRDMTEILVAHIESLLKSKSDRPKH